MIKTLLRFLLVFSAATLAFGLIAGSAEYVADGFYGILVCTGVALVIWIPMAVLIIKYINEKEDQ